MTKVTILGQSHEDVKPKKKIEFVKLLAVDGDWVEDNNTSWTNITLICLDYTLDGLDLMYAYDKDSNDGVLYLGHFNDGEV